MNLSPGDCTNTGTQEGHWSIQELYETVTFSDTTTISGDISTFARTMNYNSIIDMSGDICRLRAKVIPPINPS